MSQRFRSSADTGSYATDEISGTAKHTAKEPCQSAPDIAKSILNSFPNIRPANSFYEVMRRCKRVFQDRSRALQPGLHPVGDPGAQAGPVNRPNHIAGAVEYADHQILNTVKAGNQSFGYGSAESSPLDSLNQPIGCVKDTVHEILDAIQTVNDKIGNATAQARPVDSLHHLRGAFKDFNHQALNAFDAVNDES